MHKIMKKNLLIFFCALISLFIYTAASASAPLAPTDTEAVVLASGKDVYITWTDISTNETRFDLERRTGAEWSLVAEISADGTNYTNTNLSDGAYDYRVKACNADGCSAGVPAQTVGIGVDVNLNPPEGSTDVTPPVISHTTVEPYVGGAYIKWVTDELADSRIKWGTTAGAYPDFLQVRCGGDTGGYVYNHCIDLNGISYDRTYYHKIMTRDKSANQQVQELSFVSLAYGTSPVFDVTPPTVTKFTYSLDGNGRIKAEAAFSEAMDAESLTNAAISMRKTSDNSGVLGTISITASSSFEFITSNPADPGVPYELVILRIARDAARNGLVSDYVSPNFMREIPKEPEVLPASAPVETPPAEVPLPTTPPVSVPDVTGPVAKASILRVLTTGSSGDDVKVLQELLAKEGVYPQGLITGYFGDLTKQAVVRFQEKYADDVLKPAGLSGGTGFVGPSSRAKINKILQSS